MTLGQHVLLLAAGFLGGIINSVSSGGSFITYPAMLATGLSPIQASTTTLVALTPGNLLAIPEYWPEVMSHKRRYPALLATVFAGCLIGVGLLLLTGSDVFEDLVPWLILVATLCFAASPRLRDWAVAHASSLTDGRIGAGLIFVFSIYLTYFGSGVGNLMLAMLTIRGFGDFLGANAAKNVVMSLGTTIAAVAYSITGWVQWEPLIPVFVGSALGGLMAAKVARRVPVRLVRAFVITVGLTVAVWMFI